MSIEKINIEKFLQLAKQFSVFDVRSPGEFTHAHIPDAISLPLFSDEERKIVGTTYKQQSRENAIKIGLDFFGVKMKKMIEEVEKLISNSQQAISKNQLPITNCLLVYCWRGGMRSAGVAWLLDLYGFKVYPLAGGYKAFRNWVLKQFEKPYHLKIVGGYTGSGKTYILKELERSGNAVIDLEEIANHKGSAFGSLGEKPQPTQETFENLLAIKLNEVRNKKYEERKAEENPTSYFLPPISEIWLEDESQRIGRLSIPKSLWHNMRNSPVYFFDIPFEERLQHLVEEYGNFEKEKLVDGITRIAKRLGGFETKNAMNYLEENNIKESFRILLSYYDKWYKKGLYNRENAEALLNTISCQNVDAVNNANKLCKQEV